MQQSSVFWCARQDLNLHAFALEPKSSVSANSTTGAYSWPPRGRVYYIIPAHLMLILFVTTSAYQRLRTLISEFSMPPRLMMSAPNFSRSASTAASAL